MTHDRPCFNCEMKIETGTKFSPCAATFLWEFWLASQSFKHQKGFIFLPREALSGDFQTCLLTSPKFQTSAEISKGILCKVDANFVIQFSRDTMYVFFPPGKLDTQLQCSVSWQRSQWVSSDLNDRGIFLVTIFRPATLKTLDRVSTFWRY